MTTEHMRPTDADYLMLKEEDEREYWGDDREFRDFSESRDEHHIPVSMWAGEEQKNFGAHRRGPSRNQ